MSKINDDFEEVSVGKRAVRNRTDEDALKLDDSQEFRQAAEDLKKEEEEHRARLERRRAEAAQRQKEQKSGKGKTVILLIVAIIVVIALVVGGKMLMNKGSGETAPAETTTPAASETEASTEAETESKPSIELGQDTNPDILELVKNYYNARATQDTEAMTAVLDSSVTIDTEELANEAEFLEAYQDVKTYVTAGMQDEEYAVFICYSMKFKNIETAAPGMVPAYVKKDENGTLRLITKEAFDETTKAFMNEVSGSQEVDALTTQVSDAFEAAQASDADLMAFIAALKGEEVETSEAAETESTEETTTAASTAAIEFEEVDNMMYATTQVRCRKAPTTEGEDYVLVDKGERVHVIGTSEEWYKVQLQGDRKDVHGYIKKDYLSEDQPDMDEE